MFRIHGLQGFRIGEEWLCIRRPEHDQHNLATVLFDVQGLPLQGPPGQLQRVAGQAQAPQGSGGFDPTFCF